MFLLFLFLTALYPLRKTPGQIVAVLMFCYGLHRYCNELLRIDPRPKGIESYTSLVLIAAGLLMTLWLLFRPTRKLA
jgi:prolipoprotein diacylglyceryltransferase